MVKGRKAVCGIQADFSPQERCVGAANCVRSLAQANNRWDRVITANIIQQIEQGRGIIIPCVNLYRQMYDMFRVITICKRQAVQGKV
jgi:hypothetical protein